MMTSALVAPAFAAEVSYDHDVRPILTANCYACHGPDGSTRKAKLRLDTEQTARPVLKDLLKRISHIDLEERMPPPKSGKKLSAAQIATLRQWIAQGAKWEKHWSLKPLKRPPLPQLTDAEKKWARNPIDHFIAAKQREHGLHPSPEANPLTLIRRLTFDLTGLPPTPKEIAAFRQATIANGKSAFVNLTNRLLASPHYGERWGRH